MTLRVYEYHLNLFDGQPMTLISYAITFFPVATAQAFGTIKDMETNVLAELEAQGKLRQYTIVNTESTSGYAGVPYDGGPHATWPTEAHIGPDTQRIGQRLEIIDMTIEEVEAELERQCIEKNLVSELEIYHSAMAQIKNDPKITWRRYWQLVSTTP